MSRLGLATAFAVSAAALPSSAQEPARFGFGSAASQDEIKGWNIDAQPDGSGLPPGSGTVAQGREVYNQRCVTCHAEDLKGPMGALVGGRGTLDTNEPLRTVGSYWPYATTLWDYVHRAMPFDAPNSLSDEETYAVTAYVLFRNDLISENETMNADTLPRVKMPNRDSFHPDTRPDVYNTPCRRNCRDVPASQQLRRPGGAASGTVEQTGAGGGGSPQ